MVDALLDDCFFGMRLSMYTTGVDRIRGFRYIHAIGTGGGLPARRMGMANLTQSAAV